MFWPFRSFPTAPAQPAGHAENASFVGLPRLDGPKIASKTAKRASKTAEMAPREHKMAPRCLPDGPRCIEDGTRWPQDGPRGPQRFPRGLQSLPRSLPVDLQEKPERPKSKMFILCVFVKFGVCSFRAFRLPKTVQEAPEMAPRTPQRPPRWPHD